MSFTDAFERISNVYEGYWVSPASAFLLTEGGYKPYFRRGKMVHAFDDPRNNVHLYVRRKA